MKMVITYDVLTTFSSVFRGGKSAQLVANGYVMSNIMDSFSCAVHHWVIFVQLSRAQTWILKVIGSGSQSLFSVHQPALHDPPIYKFCWKETWIIDSSSDSLTSDLFKGFWNDQRDAVCRYNKSIHHFSVYLIDFKDEMDFRAISAVLLLIIAMFTSYTGTCS